MCVCVCVCVRERERERERKKRRERELKLLQQRRILIISKFEKTLSRNKRNEHVKHVMNQHFDAAKRG